MGSSAGEAVRKSRARGGAPQRRKGSGGVIEVRPGVFRVDVEVDRDPVTHRRRRVSRVVRGTRDEAEVTLARLRVANHERRLPTGTKARSIGAALDLYLARAEHGDEHLAPRTVVTVGSAVRTMKSTVLADGREFGSIPLSRASWQDVEALFGAMRSAKKGAAWIQRCATVLSRAFDLARERGLISSNPVRDATRPKLAKVKPYSPSAQEVRTLLAAVQEVDGELADAVVLLASTGLRKGELWRCGGRT